MGEFIKVGSSGSSGSSTFDGLSDKATVDLPVVNTPLSTVLNAKEATSNKKTDVDANKTSDTFFPTVKAVFSWVSSLFVKGAASSTDNAVARFDGATGKLVKNSSVVIHDNGNVGIGTTSPSRKLHVAVNSPDGVAMTNVAGDGFSMQNDETTSYFLSLTSGNSARDFNISGKNLYFRSGVSYAENMRIDVNGNVSIGMVSPTAKLDVNGTFRSRGVATFNGQIIDNTGSAGVDGQVLKKVGGQVSWSNP